LAVIDKVRKQAADMRDRVRRLATSPLKHFVIAAIGTIKSPI
jgi:hypothetical protein